MATKNTTITISVAGSQNYLPISKTINVSSIISGTSLTDIVTSSKLINDDNPIIIYDENSLWKGKPIEWQVIGIDQDGNNTVTLQVNSVLTGFAWDTKNTSGDSNRQSSGANRVDSLLHQWLNSDQINWYSSQHSNQAPSTSTVDSWNMPSDYNNFMKSSTNAGFMTNLSNDFKNKLISVTKYISPYQSGDPSSFTGKLFCLSVREVNPSYTNQYYTEESNAFTYQRFQKNSSNRRIINSSTWWLRSPHTSTSVNMWTVDDSDGVINYQLSNPALWCTIWTYPACVLPSNIRVEVDENGKYKIVW